MSPRLLLTAAGLLTLLTPLHAQTPVPAPCLDRAPADRTYTRVRLLDMVKNQTPVRAEYLIRTCGVRIPFNAELEGDLKESGAEDNVIAAVREVAPKPVKAAAPPPPAAVVEKKPDPPAGPKQGDIRTNPKDGLRYVFIPPGEFRMGCSPNDSQ